MFIQKNKSIKPKLLLEYWSIYCGNGLFAQKALKRLVHQYSQPWRHYHTLDHIEQMLQLFKQYESSTTSPPTIFLAICYHDCIYLPWWKNNEKRSADKATIALEKLQLDSLSPDVTQMIHSTEKHQPLVDNVDTKLLLDFDLTILGSNWEHYLNYCQQIRKEYWFIPKKKYLSGRKNILMQFLNREKLYFSDIFFEQYEHQARLNIQREINLLEN